jgi:hypothetical protein
MRYIRVFSSVGEFLGKVEEPMVPGAKVVMDKPIGPLRPVSLVRWYQTEGEKEEDVRIDNIEYQEGELAPVDGWVYFAWRDDDYDNAAEYRYTLLKSTSTGERRCEVMSGPDFGCMRPAGHGGCHDWYEDTDPRSEHYKGGTP